MLETFIPRMRQPSETIYTSANPPKHQNHFLEFHFAVSAIEVLKVVGKELGVPGYRVYE